MCWPQCRRSVPSGFWFPDAEQRCSLRHDLFDPRRILQNVYAAGVASLTQLEFVRQRESTNTWLARFNGELRDDVVLLGVAPMVDRLV